MADIEASVQIDRPPAAVFDFISDPRQVPRWQPLYESAELVGDATLRLGSRIRYRRRRGDAIEYRVAALEPNHRLDLTEYDRPRVLTSYVLESAAGGTRLTCRCALLHDAMPAPLRWLILAFFTTALRGAVATALGQAKFAIEHPGEAAPARAGLHVQVNAAVHGAPPPPAAPGPEERYSTAFLVGANLLPLVGVLWLGWDVASIVLLYWAENLIAGFYNALRMATASGPLVAKLALIPFFIFHYGMFCTVHGALLVGLFHLEPRVHVSGLSAPALFAAVARMPGMAWPLLALFASHGVSFVEHHFVRGERAMGAASFMGRPYGRMIVLHVAIILGGFGVAALGASSALLVVLVGLKLALDVFAHRRSHGPAAGPAPTRAIPA